MTKKQLERWSPVLLLLVILALWQFVVAVFDIAEYIFPAPLAIAQAKAEFAGPIAQAA